MNDFQITQLLLLGGGAAGIWMIAALLQKGLNEHVRAMQALYERLEQRDRERP